jgi:hypothetical protein
MSRTGGASGGFDGGLFAGGGVEMISDGDFRSGGSGGGFDASGLAKIFSGGCCGGNLGSTTEVSHCCFKSRWTSTCKEGFGMLSNSASTNGS